MLATEADIKLVKDYLEIPYAIDTLTININKIKKSEFKIPELFVAHLEQLKDDLFRKHKDVKISMRKQGIRVYEEKRTDQGVEAKYLCRGYHQNMSLHGPLIRSDVLKLLAELLNVDIDKVNNGFWGQ